MSEIRKQMTIPKILKKIDVELWRIDDDRKKTEDHDNIINLGGQRMALKSLKKWIYEGI